MFHVPWEGAEINLTKIEWCHGIKARYQGETVERQGYTWNPMRGCSPESTGCLNCYAGSLATRFSGVGGAFEGYAERHRTGRGGAAWTGKVDLLTHKLADPLKVRKPGAIFVNSMSDLFHESLTFEEIAAVVGVMAATPWHLHMTLTKRAARMREWFEWVAPGDPQARCLSSTMDYFGHNLLDTDRHRASIVACQSREWPLPNWRIGVSAEDQQRWDERVPELLRCPAAFRFVSCEPLLSGIGLLPLLDAQSGATHGGSSQDAGQSGGGHQKPERHPQDSSSRNRQREEDEARSEGGREHPVEGYGAASGADSPVGGGSADDASGNCQDLRHHAERGVGHRDRESLGTSGRYSSMSKTERKRRVRLNAIHQIIVGGESGHGARPCRLEWIDSLVEQCRNTEVKVFCKQHGSNPINGEFHGLGYKDKKGGEPREWIGGLERFPRQVAP